MRIVETKVYKFNELSEEAKEKALQDFRYNEDYPWLMDNSKVLDTFCNIFPVKVSEWEYSYQKYINYRLTCDDDIEELSGIRLLKYLWNNYGNRLFKGKYYSKDKYINGKYTYKCRYSKVTLDHSCVLTGYCIDDDILQPIYNFMKQPKSNVTFTELIDDCLNAWLDACEKDYEWYFSDESLTETIEVNEYEFTEEGELH